MTVRAAILGGTGYGGMELLRYLLGHPQVEVTALTSRSETGEVAERHPHLRNLTDLCFTLEDEASRARLAAENDVLLYAKPHGVASGEIPALLEANDALCVIDLSGDFRLRDPEAYPTWYGYDHPHADWLARSAYGLPEVMGRDALREARLIANPGCHASATLLAVWPLVDAGLVTGRISVASVTGSSGSGATAKKGTHHPERFSNFKAYRPLEHQHLPEVVQALGGSAVIDFVPHSAPIARGIYVTAFVPVGDADADAVRGAYVERYAAEVFVRATPKPPELRAVAGTNFVDMHVTAGDGIAVVNVAVDNLGKGMAGSAVQNLNLRFGLEETAGLDRPGAGL